MPIYSVPSHNPAKTYTAPVLVGLLAAPPPALPSAPLSLSGTPGDAEVALIWTVPASDGGATITDYIVQYRT